MPWGAVGPCSRADPPCPPWPHLPPCADTCLHPARPWQTPRASSPHPALAYPSRLLSVTVGDAVAMTTTRIRFRTLGTHLGLPLPQGVHGAGTGPPPRGGWDLAHGRLPLALVSRTHPAGPAGRAAATGSRGCPSGAPAAFLPAAPLLLLHCRSSNGCKAGRNKLPL